MERENSLIRDDDDDEDGNVFRTEGERVPRVHSIRKRRKFYRAVQRADVRNSTLESASKG